MTASRENESLKFDHATRPQGTMTLAAAEDSFAAVVAVENSRGAQVEVVVAAAVFVFFFPAFFSSPRSCASDLDRTYLLWFWWNLVSSYAR